MFEIGVIEEDAGDRRKWSRMISTVVTFSLEKPKDDEEYCDWNKKSLEIFSLLLVEI